MGFIGSGIMARSHMREMIRRDLAEVVAVCEPSGDAYAATVDLFASSGATPPANEPDWRRFVSAYADRLDAVFIVTPHALHFEQASACLEAGLDVLLEKPMVMNADEATALISTRDRTGRLLVVSFQGSLSPQVRTASRMLRSGELGAILGIDAVVWQDWAQGTAGTWRQDVRPIGRRLPVRHGRAHAQHRLGPRRRGLQLRSRRGSRTTARRSTPGRSSWAGSDRARWSPCMPAAAPSRRAIRTSGCSAAAPSSGPGSGASAWRSSGPGAPDATDPAGGSEPRLGALRERPGGP